MPYCANRVWTNSDQEGSALLLLLADLQAAGELRALVDAEAERMLDRALRHLA
jgi:hypothetical protein